MIKTSIASLQERLADWVDWDGASYEVGACLGFWSEYGAPVGHAPGNDPWHGAKGIIWSANPLGDAIANFIWALVEAGVLESRDEPDISFRWNKNYKIV